MGGKGREKGTRRVPRTEGARRAAANVGCNSEKEGAWSPEPGGEGRDLADGN